MHILRLAERLHGSRESAVKGRHTAVSDGQRGQDPEGRECPVKRVGGRPGIAIAGVKKKSAVVKEGWHRAMDEYQREDLIKKVEENRGRRSQILKELKVARSTYYQWRKMLDENGMDGLSKRKPVAKRIWNKLTPEEENKVLAVAKYHPELSPRLLAFKITDEEDFSVSEAAVYRVLKDNDLIAPRPLPEMPSAKSWKHKTSRPDEIWQCDATNIFIVGWGYYKLIPVEDDYSRKIIAWDIRPDETAFSFSDVVELAVEQAKKEGHLLDKENMPALYTDNGAGFTSHLMADYLAAHGYSTYHRDSVSSTGTRQD